jgi:hypothetical protein
MREPGAVRCVPANGGAHLSQVLGSRAFIAGPSKRFKKGQIMGEDTAGPPRLEFIDGVWCGQDDVAQVSMDDDTLRLYALSYLEVCGIARPLPQELDRALRSIRRLPYWYSLRGDPAVSVVMREGAIPRLHYNEVAHRYEGQDGVISAIVNRDALLFHTLQYLKRIGITAPSKDDRASAERVILTVAHWHGYDKTGEGASVIPVVRSAQGRQS